MPPATAARGRRFEVGLEHGRRSAGRSGAGRSRAAGSAGSRRSGRHVLGWRREAQQRVRSGSARSARAVQRRQDLQLQCAARPATAAAPGARPRGRPAPGRRRGPAARCRPRGGTAVRRVCGGRRRGSPRRRCRAGPAQQLHLADQQAGRTAAHRVRILGVHLASPFGAAAAWAWRTRRARPSRTAAVNAQGAIVGTLGMATPKGCDSFSHNDPMPELPEVEVTRRSIDEPLRGARVRRCAWAKPLRWPLGVQARIAVGLLASARWRAAASTCGCRCGATRRRRRAGRPADAPGHVGLAVAVRPCPPGGPHDHFDLDTDRGLLRLTDPRRFGAVVWSPGSTPTRPPVAGQPGCRALRPAH
jgi:hypothetical protein